MTTTGRTAFVHADHTSAKIHLDAELARTNPSAYTSIHIASLRQADGYGGYLHVFEVINHTKADHVPHAIYVIRMVDGLWQVVS